MPTQTPPDPIDARRSRMRTLAGADVAVLRAAWQRWGPRPSVQTIRGPEAGLVMVRGRIDATGARFNVGEATVSRATVRLHGAPLADDLLGSAYVLGTDLEHARLAAIFDGLALDPRQHDRVADELLAPLRDAATARDAAARADARSTLVDFFTVSREHA